MNDKDRELIAQVLRSAGQAGEQGFGYLVQYRFIDGITSIIGYGLAIAGALWLLRRAFAWAPKPNSYNDPPVPKYLAIVALCIASFCFLCGFMNGFNSILAPEGAAIQSALRAIGK